MAATVQQVLERARENYARLLVLCTQVITTPTRENIDALVIAADGSGIMRPTITHSVGNRSEDWTGYQNFIVTQIEKLNELIRQSSGPYSIRTIGRV